MSITKQHCIYCSAEIKGRSDKQFCSTSCKSAHHNTKPDSTAAVIIAINKKLRANRSAMRKACPSGKATVRKDFLITLGMDFKYSTHSWQGKAGQTYYFCYDYGYALIDDSEKVLIVQQQIYMK